MERSYLSNLFFWYIVSFSHVYVIGRYTLDVDLKTVVTAEKLEATASRVEARKVSAINISYNCDLENYSLSSKLPGNWKDCLIG
jgi:hypothetical protein